MFYIFHFFYNLTFWNNTADLCIFTSLAPVYFPDHWNVLRLPSDSVQGQRWTYSFSSNGHPSIGPFGLWDTFSFIAHSSHLSPHCLAAPFQSPLRSPVLPSLMKCWRSLQATFCSPSALRSYNHSRHLDAENSPVWKPKPNIFYIQMP